jgi:hypothetical protein
MSWSLGREGGGGCARYSGKGTSPGVNVFEDGGARVLYTPHLVRLAEVEESGHCAIHVTRVRGAERGRNATGPGK